MRVTTKRQEGIVVSDLHLLSRRSDGDTLFRQLASQLEETDALVLNGDTFDFRWSALPGESESVDAALKWVENLLDQQAHLEIFFLLGNHDCLATFHDELLRFAAEEPRLRIHEHRLQLGENLFLHGDCANRRMGERALQRFRAGWSRDQPRGPLAARAYASIDALGISRRFHDWYFPRERTVKRIAYHLDEVIPDWRERVNRCFFGHTHRPFRDYSWQGVSFANTGSGIRGMGFAPGIFSWRESESAPS